MILKTWTLLVVLEFIQLHCTTTISFENTQNSSRLYLERDYFFNTPYSFPYPGMWIQNDLFRVRLRIQFRLLSKFRRGYVGCGVAMLGWGEAMQGAAWLFRVRRGYAGCGVAM